MRAKAFALVAVAGLSACAGDESLYSYGAADKVWVLEQIDGVPFTAAARLAFPEPGKLSGTGPCNSFFADQTAPYPWFEAGPIGATKRACPELAAEAQFLAALAEMTLSEVLDNTLVLSNDAGRSLVFTAQP